MRPAGRPHARGGKSEQGLNELCAEIADPPIWIMLLIVSLAVIDRRGLTVLLWRSVTKGA